jgi:hypothetical protein
MTSFTDAAGSPPIAPFRIHYVDPPRDFSGVPIPDRDPGRPVVAALATVTTLVALAIAVVVIALVLSS